MEHAAMNTIDDNLKRQLFILFKEHGLVDKEICDRFVDFFYSTEDHLTITEFHDNLRVREHEIDRETIATMLGVMCEFGLVESHTFVGEDLKRYEHLHPHTHHDHFICTKCKKVIEVTSDKLEDLQYTLVKARGFRPLFHKLEVYGICNDCFSSENEEIPLAYAKQDSRMRVVKIDTGWNARKHLTELGFIENEPVYIIRNSGYGPMVVEIKNTRFAIGRGEALKVWVAES